VSPRVLGLAVAAFMLLVDSSPAAAQCAMCRTVLTGSAEGQSMAKGLNQGILLMLAAPYLIFGTFVAVALRRRWQPALARVAGRLRAPRRRRDPLLS
jgi:hypothetical protein